MFDRKIEAIYENTGENAKMQGSNGSQNEEHVPGKNIPVQFKKSVGTTSNTVCRFSLRHTKH